MLVMARTRMRVMRLSTMNDHGADFPDVQNAMEYAAKAQDFLRTPLAAP